MIKRISWNQIFPIWEQNLWPDRQSKIESTSAMSYSGGYNMENMLYRPTFFGAFADGKIVGVNSGHGCSDGFYRSRGLWVDENYRGNGLGKQLLLATIKQAQKEKFQAVWSYPRKSSWPTYAGAGFSLTGEWEPSETSDFNARCFLKL